MCVGVYTENQSDAQKMLDNSEAINCTKVTVVNFDPHVVEVC